MLEMRQDPSVLLIPLGHDKETHTAKLVPFPVGKSLFQDREEAPHLSQVNNAICPAQNLVHLFVRPAGNLTTHKVSGVGPHIGQKFIPINSVAGKG